MFKSFRDSYTIKSDTSEESPTYSETSEVSDNFHETVQNNVHFPKQILVKMTTPTNFGSKLKRYLSGENLNAATPETLRDEYFTMKTMMREMEEQLKVMSLQNEQLKRSSQNPNPSAPPLQIPLQMPLPESVPYFLNESDRKTIDSLLKNVMEFDGSQDVEAFKDDLRTSVDTIIAFSASTDMKESLLGEFMRGVRARKLKGEAQRVATRILPPLTPKKVSEALTIEFGRRGKTLSLLQQERNQLCQMINERVDSYIKRYSEKDRQIQRANDYTEAEFKDYERRKENLIRVKKFIDGLRNEKAVK